ncbi:MULTISPECIES: hypothetical protein [unclassified Enterobacter cloacae complex]|uniref:hypothetical protein n=1 Tax=unclassified Enterobacter cloacae complex TaxID=2757714 RepID=UPI001D02973C|nr:MULTISPECIES: hypothetical protein [unclassified Enterobacter cloacae complex]
MSVKRYDIGTFGGMSMESSSDGAYVHHEDYAALEARCAALAAELSAVEAIHNEAVFITDDRYEQCPPEVQKMIRSLAVLQIPAYQSFLAEVRAQGVEMFALMFAEEAIKTNNITTGWRAKASRAASEYAEALREDAAQIRKGVQS